MSELRKSRSGDSTLVELEGKLDASTTPAIETRLLELIRSGEKFLAIDFSAVTYLASSGLRMLLVVLRTATSLDGKIILCGLDPAMTDTLEVTGFLPYFQTAPDQAAALESLLE